MNNKKNKKLFTILLLCASFIIIVFSIISLRTYSVGTGGTDNGVDIDVDDVNISGTSHDNVSSKAILNKPQSADNYGNRNLSQVQNTSNTFINCNTNECKIKKIPDTRTQAYSNNLCWAYGASNAIESTLMNCKGDTEYNTYGIGSQNDTLPRFSPTHMGYALGKTFANNNANEYGYMNLTDGGFALDSIIYLTNGIGPILAPNKGSNNPFNVELYEHGKDYFTIPARQTIINNLNYPINYKVSEIQMISGINAETLTDNATTYPENSLVQDRINTIKTYLQEGYGITIESRSISTSNDGKCDCSRADTRSTYCDNGPHHNTDKTCFYHVMLLVGWDDDYAVSNFVSGKEPPAKGAWIARNSLNETNLVHISYYDYRSLTSDIFAITDLVRYNSNNTKYDHLYQYNPSGCDTWNYTNKWNEQSYICKDFNRISTQKIANVYDRENNSNKEQLTEVSFFVNKPTTVSVYYKEGSTVDDELFNNSNLISTKEISSKGYYTVPISGIKINNNNYVIGLSSSESGEVFAFQGKSNPLMTKEEVGITSGISYYLNGSTWTDTSTSINATNFIKAYTKDTNDPIETEPDPQQPILVNNITINNCPSTMNIGDTRALEVTFDPTNATDKTLSWNSNHPNIVSVDSNGKVTANAPGDVIITATSNSNTNVTATCNIHVNESEPTTTTYTVKYYQEKLTDNEYDEVASINKEGTIGSTITVVPENNYPGFAKPANQTITLSENTPNVAFYYNRNRHTVTLTKGDGISDTTGEGEYKYGASVTINATVSQNYQWSHWSDTASGSNITTNKQYTIESMPDYDINYTANATQQGEDQPVINYSISLSQRTMILYTSGEDTEGTLTATVNPSNSVVNWRSSNENVATVNNGVVTAVSKGTTTITATINGTTTSATCEVTVLEPELVLPTSITLNKTSITIKEGLSEELIATVLPENANDKTITWSSSNTSVATVESGMVRGIKEGTAVITARTSNGKSATCSVTVEKNPEPVVHVTSVTVTPKKHTMYVGDTYKLAYQVKPSSATDKNVIWTSNNKSVATVDQSGNVKALKAGKAIITVKSVDGSKKAQSTITVVSKPATGNPTQTPTPTPVVPKVTINMNEHNISLMKGHEYTLKATVTGSSASIIWTSSDEKVATVENGKVKGISVGTVTIRAKINGTTISDICEVKVITEGEVGIKFASEEIVVYLDKEKNIELVTVPTDMQIEKKEYTIEDKEIISIENDKITGLKLGSTKLKVKVNDKYEAETTVIVKEEPMTLEIEGYNINFSENIYSYELEIGKEKELKITSNKDIDIKGNEKLKNKSKITITNIETQKEYEIIIKKKNGLTIYFIIITTLLAGLCIYTFIRRKRNS